MTAFVSPNASRLAPVVKVREEWGSWLIGCLVRFPDVTVELGWENWQKLKTFSNTPLVYIGLWRGKQLVYESQLGHSLAKPDPEIEQELIKLLQLFVGYAPYCLAPREYKKDRHEFSLQPMSQRQHQGDRQSLQRLRKRHKKAARVPRMRVPVHHP